MMSIFSLPDSLISEIQSMMANFWWGSTGDRRSMHWHNWMNMCLPNAKGGMGFRDLRTFNSAMLAKHLWRIHSDMNPLLSKFLKARYFKHSDILSSHIGYDPSYTWRSLWGAKDLLLKGLAWRVGNGSSISVWNDVWVPRTDGYSKPTGSSAADHDLRVCDLIDMENMSWNSETLANIFDTETVTAILSIPLPTTPKVDKIFWWSCTDGLYRVKSGYHLGLSSTDRLSPVQNSDDDRVLWRRIWNINIPPKAQHFLWRLGKESIAVNPLRHRRHCTDSPNCSRCTTGVEDFYHALVECPKSTPIRSKNPTATLIMASPRSSSKVFLKWVLDHADKEEMMVACASLWAAWFIRNKQCLDNANIDPVQTTAAMIKGVQEYEVVSKRVSINRSPNLPSSPKWIPPMEDWVKVNFDAMVKDGMCRGLGAVL